MDAFILTGAFEDSIISSDFCFLTFFDADGLSIFLRKIFVKQCQSAQNVGWDPL